MKKKYTKKQIQEAIKYWEKQLKAGNYKKLNESDEPKMATGANINSKITDSTLKSNITKFIEKESWFNALVFAYIVLEKASSQFAALYKRDESKTEFKKVGEKFYNAADDVKNAMFAAANDAKFLPMK